MSAPTRASKRRESASRPAFSRRTLRRPRDEPRFSAEETEENGSPDAVGVDRMDFMQNNDDRGVDFDDVLEPSGCDSESQADLSVRTLRTRTLEMTPDAT